MEGKEKSFASGEGDDGGQLQSLGLLGLGVGPLFTGKVETGAVNA
jgi:hypothetical protein